MVRFLNIYISSVVIIAKFVSFKNYKNKCLFEKNSNHIEVIKVKTKSEVILSSLVLYTRIFCDDRNVYRTAQYGNLTSSHI